jgi:hypothetical protein
VAAPRSTGREVRAAWKRLDRFEDELLGARLDSHASQSDRDVYLAEAEVRQREYFTRFIARPRGVPPPGFPKVSKGSRRGFGGPPRRQFPQFPQVPNARACARGTGRPTLVSRP